MNFKNMSIRKSLIIGFGTTILVSVAIIIASLIMMSSQKSAYSDIIDRYLGANELVSECRIDYNIAARNLRDAVISGDTSGLSSVTAKIDELTARLSELRSVYPLSDKTQLDTFVRTVEEWETEAKNIADTARTDRNSAAEMIVSTCTPKLSAAATAGDAVASELQAAQAQIINQQNRSSTIGIVIIIGIMVIATAVVLMGRAGRIQPGQSGRARAVQGHQRAGRDVRRPAHQPAGAPQRHSGYLRHHRPDGQGQL